MHGNNPFLPTTSSVPVPSPVPASVPSPVTSSVPASVPIPTPVPSPVPTSVHVHVPSPVPTPIHVPVPVLTPIPVPISAPASQPIIKKVAKLRPKKEQTFKFPEIAYATIGFNGSQDYWVDFDVTNKTVSVRTMTNDDLEDDIHDREPIFVYHNCLRWWIIDTDPSSGDLCGCACLIEIVPNHYIIIQSNQIFAFDAPNIVDFYGHMGNSSCVYSYIQVSPENELSKYFKTLVQDPSNDTCIPEPFYQHLSEQLMDAFVENMDHTSTCEIRSPQGSTSFTMMNSVNGTVIHSR